MINRLIKNKKDYDAALSCIDQLMDAKSDTVEMDELELLTALVEMYEERHFPISPPDPIDAIKFRMEQMGLVQKDMVPYIGTKSKVSEVLNGKRPLTLSMMRSLNKDLGIPAEVLLKEPGADFPDQIQEMEWSRFPLLEMAKRNWIPMSDDIREKAEELIRDFIEQAGGLDTVPKPCFRQGKRGRYNAKMDLFALTAWCIRVQSVARNGLIPKRIWDRKPISGKAPTAEIYALAEKLKIHPAIVAGRIRFEKNNYRLLSRHVGNKQIRKHFADSFIAKAS